MKKKQEQKSTFQIVLKDVTEEKNLEIHKELTLDNVNIQNIELLKIKLSHKLPSKQNYLLSKTFTFYNSNSPALNKFVSSLCLSLDLSYRESTVAAPISFH